MSRGCGKSYRKGAVQTSIHFENLFKENSNRPSAARSAGIVGKWGITSFTSIRDTNGVGRVHRDDYSQKRRSDSSDQNSSNDPFSFNKDSNTVPPVIKPKKFFKSRNVDIPDSGVRSDAALYAAKTDLNTYGAPTKKSKTSNNKITSPPKTSPRTSTKRFFPSKNSTSNAETTSVPVPTLSPRLRDDGKPPIVLRISKGKSRLLSDSDESPLEPPPATPTVSVGLTSPTGSTKSSTQRSPAHSRVTRSSQRNQQSDTDNSVTSGSPRNDTYGTIFTSTSKRSSHSLDLEPQYIPAEEYERERKAMYENLLGMSSPTYVSSLQSSQSENSSQEIDKKDSADPSTQNNIAVSSSEEISLSQIQIASDSENLMNELQTQLSQESERPPPPPDELTDAVPTEQEESTEKTVLETGEGIEERKNKNPAKKKLQQQNSSTDSDSDAPSDTLSETIAKTKSSSQESECAEEKRSRAEEAPSVKLVISKKKGSIFKSRSLVGGSKKRHALYKHKWCDDKEASGTQKSGCAASDDKTQSTSDGQTFDEMDFDAAPLTRVTHWPDENTDEIDQPEAITSIKCTKKAKGFYTVVRNVKKAHQIQEIGEFQEFNDDVDYLLDALQDNNPSSTRCLSAITLATKCMTPAFRMHLRAHGIVAKFFKALHDATKDQSLGLCTATVMFVLSQDRLNMDLDRDCLELMLNLLESDVSHRVALDDCGMSSAQLRKNKQKVRELCAEIQSQGHAKHLNLDNITVGHLAMETLLSLTSKRAGEWFKEELRELGGLEHIIKTICECCRQVSDYVVTWTDVLLDKLRKVDRCMRVLENVTQANEENQTYILEYDGGNVLNTLVKLFRLCDAEIPLYPVTDSADKESTGAVIREALLVTLKVLINLTHHFNDKSMGSVLIGQEPGIMDASLHLLLQVPNYIPEQKKFELSVLVLMLLINLIQHTKSNKKLLIEAKAPAKFESIFPCGKSAVEALIEQFNACEQLAVQVEQRTDAILDGKDKATELGGGTVTQNKSHEEFIEETVDKLLQKAGSHMEHTMIGSYIVLLLGHLIMDNDEYENCVRTLIPSRDFSAMRAMLVKYFNFMNLTASGEASTVCHIKATERVIKYLQKCDCPSSSNAPAVSTSSQQQAKDTQSDRGSSSDLQMDIDHVGSS